MKVFVRALCLGCALPFLAPTVARAAFDADLQGRSAGSTTWVSNPLRGWRELDLVPARVYMTGGPVNNKSLRIEIDHLTAGVPGIEDLSRFTTSTNVKILSGPIISAPAGASKWSYSFTVNLLNSQPGYIEFRARLASGSLANPGSSLHLYGVPALGVLQFQKISQALSTDLLLTKTGPAIARPGEIISYTLNYSTKTSANGPAGNVELTDALPVGVTYVANSATKTPTVSGSTLSWNLGILDPGTNGSLTFQVKVTGNVTNGQILENVAGLTTDQTDINLVDNTARFRTTIAFNTLPVATDDAYAIAEDNALTVPLPGVLANDTDADHDSLTAVLVTGPQHGQLSFLSNGSFVYSPESNYVGPDQFTYAANDGLTNSVPAHVAITITPVNDAPMGRPDAYETLEDRPLSIAAPGVLGNDTDVEGQSLQAAVISNPSHGTLTLNASGAFTYSPETNFYGTDTFVYRANDGDANSQPTTVTITVAPVNDAPSFIKGANQVVPRNRGAVTVAQWATAIMAGPANEANQHVQFAVSNDRQNLFLQQPKISTNGTLSFTCASNVYGIATVYVALKDDGGTANGGVDTSAPQTFTIQINQPPTATLIIPTNGTVFLAPANIPIVASAEDIDGTVAKVEIFESLTNKLAEFAQMPYAVVWSNVTAGAYNLTARATDNFGATGISQPVAVTVLSGPPVATGALRFNPQTGLFEQPIRVTNPSSFGFSAVCIFVSNLPQLCRVWNASGTSNGLPFIQYNLPVAPGHSVDMIIEYYDPLRTEPKPILYAEAVSPMEPINPVGTELRVNRQRWLSDGTFLLEFNSALNRTYYVQYCDDLTTWKTVVPTISGTGTRTQWIDNGPPRTDSAPARSKTRLYRVVVTP